MTRTEQRTALISARRAISADLRKKWDAQIGEQVLAWCKANSVQLAGMYMPIQGEPSLNEIFPSLIEIGVKLSLPIAPEDNRPLVFASWSPGEELMKDRFGVLVPLESATIVKPEVIFVPCVGYTAEGYRLGYGGGYYDRTLAELPKPQTIGIAYRICQCELTIMPHDVALDCIITDY